MDTVKSKVPAGLVDDKVEFFLEKDELYVSEGGITTLFKDISTGGLNLLSDILDNSPVSNQALDEMGIFDPMERLKQFARCRFAACNSTPDLSRNGDSQPEYFECDRRQTCKQAGILCINLSGPGGHLTPREIEITKLIAQGYLDKEIAKKLNISTHTSEKHRRNIEGKISNGTSIRKVDIARFAFENNII